MSDKAGVGNKEVQRLRFANGPRRPQYLDSRDADMLVMMVLTLSAEVSALRERLDTHERLADAGKLSAVAAVESFQPVAAVEQARAAARRALIDRVTRVLLEEPVSDAPNVTETQS